MKVVYICSPFSADPVENVERAKRYCKQVTLQVPNVVPFSPLLMFPFFLDEATQRELALNMGVEMLNRCDELWVFSHNGQISDGMAMEIQLAKEAGKKVKFISQFGEAALRPFC